MQVPLLVAQFSDNFIIVLFSWFVPLSSFPYGLQGVLFFKQYIIQGSYWLQIEQVSELFWNFEENWAVPWGTEIL